MPDIVNFKMVDVDGDGKITADEFKAACGKGLVKNTNSKIMYRWRSKHGTMSAMGHKQTSRDVRVTSALPPIADIRRMSWHVR
jgi:hypothetical protein